MQFQESKPIYLQIADKIMDDILSGSFREEMRLPSVREYAASVEVNANTVMRSYDYLQQREVIYNRRGIGFFVAPGAPQRVSDLRRATFMDSELPYFLGRLKSLGFSPSELADLYSNFLSNQSN
ncbi:MAG: GntR family transcriptional regulator [Pseudoflavonifractor sp.]|nr:GntR family transcriptional regulator [Alloprevotella sp.]MCM1117317.1 GntR family transcriptional regulator [Pseudoflavonifractor sp.]